MATLLVFTNLKQPETKTTPRCQALHRYQWWYARPPPAPRTHSSVNTTSGTLHPIAKCTHQQHHTAFPLSGSKWPWTANVPVTIPIQSIGVKWPNSQAYWLHDAEICLILVATPSGNYFGNNTIQRSLYLHSNAKKINVLWSRLN